MKKVIFTLVVAMLISVSVNAQWVQMSSGISNSETVFSIVSKDSTLYVGTYNGVYYSTNIGNSWIQTSLNNYVVYSFAISGNNIFAGTSFEGIYKSSNNGANWNFIGLYGKSITSIIVKGDTIFAGSYVYGVYISTNSGNTWGQTSLGSFDVGALAINGNILYAGTQNYGIYLSTNLGNIWSQTSLNNKSIKAIIIAGSNIYAGTILYQGVFFSSDNGYNWIQTSLNNKSIYSLYVNANNVFAGGVGGAFVSTNNGTTWNAKNEGFITVPYIYSFAITDNFIFGGTAVQSIWRRPVSELTALENISNQIPSSFSLMQNFPNPFNPSTNIKYQIMKSGFVSLKVFDALGKEVATLVNEKQDAGTYSVTFDASLGGSSGSGISSGIYFYKLTSGDFTETKRMILLK